MSANTPSNATLLGEVGPAGENPNASKQKTPATTSATTTTTTTTISTAAAVGGQAAMLRFVERELTEEEYAVCTAGFTRHGAQHGNPPEESERLGFVACTEEVGFLFVVQ